MTVEDLLKGAESGDKLLVEANLEFCGARDSNDLTSLFIATEKNHYEIVELLVKHEYGLISNGITSLMHAASIGNTECIKILLPYEGGMLSLKTGNTALFYAIQTGKYEAAELLYEKEGSIRCHGITPLMQAALFRFDFDSRWASLLHKHIGDRASSNGGNTALITAILASNLSPIPFLTSEYYISNNGGNGPMHYSILFIPALKLLRNSLCRTRNSSGRTALMLALTNKKPDAVPELVPYEARCIDSSGKTALYHACEIGVLDMVTDELIQEEFYIQCDGRTPLDYCKQQGKQKFVDRLSKFDTVKPLINMYEIVENIL